jgi:hypothetical protein
MKTSAIIRQNGRAKINEQRLNMAKEYVKALVIAILIAGIACTWPREVGASQGGVGQAVVNRAIERGVAANTIILLLLLPLIATMVSVVHYIGGLTGYGIFMPTMIAVTFSATGISGGLVLFGVVLVVSMLSNWWLRGFRLHFWPSRAVGLLLISLATFGVMVGTSLLRAVNISGISIFPLLFLIMLTEEFVRTQLAKSRKEAINLMIGTLVLAVGGAMLMNLRWLQEIALKFPEAVIIIVVGVNLLVGNYRGMRLMEFKRFREAIRDKQSDKR